MLDMNWVYPEPDSPHTRDIEFLRKNIFHFTPFFLCSWIPRAPIYSLGDSLEELPLGTRDIVDTALETILWVYQNYVQVNKQKWVILTPEIPLGINYSSIQERWHMFLEFVFNQSSKWGFIVYIGDLDTDTQLELSLAYDDISYFILSMLRNEKNMGKIRTKFSRLISSTVQDANKNKPGR